MSGKVISAVLTACLVAICSQAASAQVAPTGTWASKTTSTDNYDMTWGGACSDGITMYYWSGNWDYQGHWAYDSTTDSWTTLPSLPSPAYDSAGCNYGGPSGYNYAFGDSYYYTGAVKKYDITSQSWEELSVVTPHTFRASAAVSGSYIYLMCGYDDTYGDTFAVTRFDPSNDTISSPGAMANCPGNGEGCGLATSPITGKMYLTIQNGCYEYTPNATTGTWVTMPTMPNYRYWHRSFASLSGRIYVVGGDSGTLIVDEFFPQGATGTWTRRANALSSHYYMFGSGLVPSTGKCYVWGGAYDNRIEEYTPPSFGAAPNPAATVQQMGSLGVTLQAGPNPDIGWTDSNIAFQANITDPDAGQQVRFEIQVKPAAAAWTAATTLTTALGAQGMHSVSYPIPTGGDYDWRYHAVDAFGNYTPNVGGVPAWTEFNNNAISPDFRSDQVAPSQPQGIFPDIYDVSVPSIISGDVTFQWTVSTDNGPASAIRYSIQVSHNDAGFGTPSPTASGIVATNQTFNLAVSRYDYYYRVGATDIGGNFSGWGATKYFRVVGNDGVNHSEGDATKVCGGSAAAAPGSSILVLAGMALTALAGLRNRRK